MSSLTNRQCTRAPSVVAVGDSAYNEYVTPAQAAQQFATTEAAVRNLVQRAVHHRLAADAALPRPRHGT
jgi:hypothetical protein